MMNTHTTHLGKLITDDEKAAAIAVGKMPAAVRERVEARARELDDPSISLLLNEGVAYLFGSLQARMLQASFGAPSAASMESRALADIYGVASDEHRRRHPDAPKATDETAPGPYSKALQDSLKDESWESASVPLQASEPKTEFKTEFKGGKIKFDVPLGREGARDFLANAPWDTRISMPVAELNRLLQKTQEAYDVVGAVKAHLVEHAPRCDRGVPSQYGGTYVLHDEGAEPPAPEPRCDRFAVRTFVRPQGYKQRLMERTTDLRCEEHDPGDGWERSPTDPGYAQLVALVAAFEATLTPEERMSVLTWEKP